MIWQIFFSAREILQFPHCESCLTWRLLINTQRKIHFHTVANFFSSIDLAKFLRQNHCSKISLFAVCITHFNSLIFTWNRRFVTYHLDFLRRKVAWVKYKIVPIMKYSIALSLMLNFESTLSWRVWRQIWNYDFSLGAWILSGTHGNGFGLIISFLLY